LARGCRAAHRLRARTGWRRRRQQARANLVGYAPQIIRRSTSLRLRRW
jgi:hypothetical protein